MNGHCEGVAVASSGVNPRRGAARWLGARKLTPILVLLAFSTLFMSSHAHAARPWDKTGFFPCGVTYVFAFGWQLDEAKKCGADMGNAGDLQTLVASRGAVLANNPNALGCVGRDVATCFLTIAQTISLTGTPANPISIPAPKTDLYGKPLDQDLSLEYGWFIGRKPPSDSIRGTIAIHISLGGDMVVKQVFAPLSASIAYAKTADDYDKSDIYEIAKALLGSACVGSDRIAFYRVLSEQMQLKGGGTDLDDDGVHHYANEEMVMCGYKLSVVTTGGITTDGYYGGDSLFVQPVS